MEESSSPPSPGQRTRHEPSPHPAMGRAALGRGVVYNRIRRSPKGLSAPMIFPA